MTYQLVELVLARLSFAALDIVEVAGIELAKLARLRRAHEEDQHRLRRTLDASERQLASAERRIADLTEAINRRSDTRGDRFAMTVAGERFTKRSEAGGRLKMVGAELLQATRPGEAGAPSLVGELAGFSLVATATKVIEPLVSVSLDEAGVEVTVGAKEWLHADPVSLVQRLERRVHGLDDALARAREEAVTSRREIEQARARLGQPFEHEERLRRLQGRRRVIEAELLGPEDASTEVQPRGAEGTSAGPSGAEEPGPQAPGVAGMRERLDRVARGVRPEPGRSL